MTVPFKDDGEFIRLDAPYAEAYIPTDLFKTKEDGSYTDSSIAVPNGDGFTLLGIFYMRIFDSENQDRETVPIRTFKYPNMIDTFPSESAKLKLIINNTEDTFRVLKYYRGDIIMNSETTKAVLNVETFNRLMMSGKIPKSLPYNDIFQAWFDSFTGNNINSAVPAVLLQIFISVVTRDATDPSVQYRKIIGNYLPGDKNIPPYISIDTNAVSATSSAMSALSFERITEKIASSINMEKSKKAPDRSPVENVLYY